MTRRLTVALIAAVAAAVGSLLASQKQAFSSRTLGVRVDVLVTDGRNPVAGLTAADFELRDNGVVQTIDVVDTSDIPINAVLALDTSASTAGTAAEGSRRRRARRCSTGSKPIDRAALTTFSNVVAPQIALTSDLTAVRQQLRASRPPAKPRSWTATYVALTATLAQTGRSLVVVCTDGYDTPSWLQPDEVLESAKRSNAVLYAVTAAEARRRSPLKDLTDATGGHMLAVDVERGSARRVPENPAGLPQPLHPGLFAAGRAGRGLPSARRPREAPRTDGQGAPGLRRRRARQIETMRSCLAVSFISLTPSAPRLLRAR